MTGQDDFPDISKFSKDRNKVFMRLSYQCCNFDCSHCDGRIHYNIKRFKFHEFDAATGKERDVYEDYTWDTDHIQVQLDSGMLQNRQNTPEGSKCECFCHREPRTSFVRRQHIVSEGKKVHELLSEEEKILLK